MTTLEVEIISRECIKPSSPTPLHLKTYKFCLLDQLSVHFYIPLALYYPMNQEQHKKHHNLQILKQSLSETLTLFYPFAGKLKDNLSIDCNDDGVPFIVAQVKGNISLHTFLTNPCLSMNKRFLPGDEASSPISHHILMTQVTTFSCGGFVIGLCLSHKISDGTGMSTFLKTWAAIAKNSQGQEGGVPLRPNFDLASSLFPQTDSFPSDLSYVSLVSPFLRKGKIGVTRFVFDASSLATLKANVKATSTTSVVLNPTSYEVVMAILFKCILRVIKAKSATNSFKPVSLSHSINLRSRAMPPLDENLIGNILGCATMLCTDEEPELDDLVLELKKVVAKFNGDFVKSLKGDGGVVKYCEAIAVDQQLYSRAVENVAFNSWRRFGLYDIDFGWGKPIWYSNHRSDDEANISFYSNCLMDTRSGDGIEAWVYMDEQEIHILQHDKELLAFAKLNPSPLLQL